MAQKRRTFIDDPDSLRDKVREVVRRIHEDEDPLEMNAYKRFVKRNVSVFNRAYFTACLVKMLLDENALPVTAVSGRKKRGRGRTDGDVRGSDAMPSGEIVSPDGFKTLFVSIGKNRRVFPKDLIALFSDVAGVSEDQFGQVKVLDNYSFVEIVPEVADQVIESSNGYDFRGRKLTVNFARQKKS